MIEVGRDIISMRDRFGVPWSKFAFLFRHGDTSTLMHSMTSSIINCDQRTTTRLLNGPVNRRDARILRDNRFIVTDTGDKRVLDKARAKVERCLQKVDITTLFLIVTDTCNLRCTYCYENLEAHSKRRTINYEDIVRAVDYFLEIASAKEPKIFFYGGEPMLAWRNVRRCIEYVRSRYGQNVSMQVTTNGTIKTDELFEVCRQYNVGVAVSIDGPAAITNITRPGKGVGLNVFESAVGLLRKLREAKIDYAALCTIPRFSAEHLDEIVNFFIAEDVRNLTFNLELKQAGVATVEDREYWDQLGSKVASAYHRLLEHGIVESRTWRYIAGLTDSTFTISECDAGYGSQIVVNPDGRIGPCQGFLSRDDYWCPMESGRDVRSLPLWQMFTEASTINMRECLECPVVGTCGGGCHYNRPTIDHPNQNFCQYMRSLVFHVIQHQ